jgi:uridine kinase
VKLRPARDELPSSHVRSSGGEAHPSTSFAGSCVGRVRVAIDGRTASGKTTIADELAHELNRIGRATIRTSIDGFHRPKRDRYARGRHSPEGYYFDARDLDAIRRLLLEPLGPGGTLTYRTASFDLETDLPIIAPTHRAGQRDILIVDGIAATGVARRLGSRRVRRCRRGYGC